MNGTKPQNVWMKLCNTTFNKMLIASTLIELKMNALWNWIKVCHICFRYAIHGCIAQCHTTKLNLVAWFCFHRNAEEFKLHSFASNIAEISLPSMSQISCRSVSSCVWYPSALSNFFMRRFARPSAPYDVASYERSRYCRANVNWRAYIFAASSISPVRIRTSPMLPVKMLYFNDQFNFLLACFVHIRND